MKELSLNILDIAENSVAANATLVVIKVAELVSENSFVITITDNGKGMSDEFLKTVTDPFSTTRTTRKVGMGISLLKLVAEQSNGTFKISSKVGEGTTVEAMFQYNHIDRPPLGNIEQTISSLVSCNLDVNFIYEHTYNSNKFTMNTKEVAELLQGVPLNNPDVVLWMQGYIREGINDISS